MRGGEREFEGATLEETLRDAANQLGIAEEDIHYRVLETGRKGLFGFGVKNVRIAVECPEGAPAAKKPRGRRRSENRPRGERTAAPAAGGEERSEGSAEDGEGREEGREGRPRRRRRRGRGRRGRGGENAAAENAEVAASEAGEEPRDDDGADGESRRGGRGERRRRGRGRRGRGRRGSGEERGGRREGSGEGRRRRDRGDRSRRRPRPEPLGEPDERPEFMDDLEGTLQKMFGLMELELDVQGEYRKSAGSRLVLSGEDLESLRDGDGEFVRSVQFVLNRMARRTWPDSGRILVVRDGDGEGDDEARDEEIIAMAEEVARRVIDEGKAVRLDAMNPYERRLVHMTIRPMRGVTTRSEGDGFHKRIKVMPRRSRRRRGERDGDRARDRETRRDDAAPPEHDQLLTSTREDMPRTRPQFDDEVDGDGFDGNGEGVEARDDLGDDLDGGDNGDLRADSADGHSDSDSDGGDDYDDDFEDGAEEDRPSR
ncbi:hypothetical protein ABI59_14925 [Acidobacteria bacterium Mor1]|nr:hypothetical protein ABI59_14925 [Acidobacteria bacterium Mor1]